MTDIGGRDPGIYTRAQLLARGYDDPAMRRAVEVGALERLRSGWFAAPGRDDRAAAAVRDGGVLTCVDALRFHGLWVPPGHRDLHLRRSSNMSGRLPACRPRVGVRRSARTAVDPVPTALAYATRCLPVDEWVAVCDSYLNTTGLTRADLSDQLAGTGATVGRWIAKVDGRAQSGTESVTRVRLRSAGFSVVVQPRIPGVGRADLRIGTLIIECDSRRHHATADGYRTDRRRDRRALVDGWSTLRLTYEDVFYAWPDVLADVRALTAGGRHRSRGGRVPVDGGT
ncbi:type IV toxin-antitoxin system AbiEi family antitoxin domain-containing protein [Gordonia shandongensis]|uniref:type IV toxin-antitoxin system AbiEi family antitoxin domain-containing protein n=1 Tax=Gordonia shandongensis TaxID=376351 RepID=UPI0003F67D73|nr:type IV toxin-antitoxin system AbiEi family antitoxin domain-containing protein [Gordonia shandongensis]